MYRLISGIFDDEREMYPILRIFLRGDKIEYVCDKWLREVVILKGLGL
jgi:hypothetical protein